MTKRRSVSRGSWVWICAQGASFASGVGVLSLVSPALATETVNIGQAYIDECDAAGVPTPPPWNYEAAYHDFGDNQWQYHGVLDDTLIVPGLTAEVFYYESANPPGVCIALPRSQFPAGQTPDEGPPDIISALGVICQGVTGNACFWDQGSPWNGTGVGPNDTYLFGDGPRSTHFVGGAELAEGRGGNCAECHRGENVFIIHPRSNGTDVIESPLGFGIPNLMPSNWHNPIVPVGWPQNEGPTNLFGSGDTDGCLACHNQKPLKDEEYGGQFPAVSTLTSDYCDTILLPSVGFSMPLLPKGGGFGSLDALLTRCDEAPDPEFSPAEKMMSMDGPAEFYWSPGPGGVEDVTGNVTEGDASMQVNDFGYVRLDSLSLNTWDLEMVGSQVAVDVYVPPLGQPEPYWLGAVQLFVTIPSAQMTNYFIGHVELTPGGTGWRTATFQLPPDVLDALLETHPDVRFGLALNTPQNAPALLLDNMRFTGELFTPASRPIGPYRYNFERAQTWSSFEGAVVGTNPTGEEAYSGYGSLEVTLNGNSDGRVWVEPTSGPTPGATVTYRVFIPSGAPVTAVQPYVADANFNWSQSWNTNIPQGGWMTVTAVIPSWAASPMREVGVKVYLSAPYSGPIYLDAIDW